MKTKDRIIESTIPLLVEKGVLGTSIKEIMEASGVSNGTLFHHFPSKEMLVEDIYVYLKEESVRVLKSNTKGTVQFKEFLWITWVTLIRFWLDNPDKFIFMSMFSKSMVLRDCRVNTEQLEFFLYNRIEEAIDTEIIEVHSSEYLVRLIESNVNTVVEYVRELDKVDMETLLKQLFNSFWRSIVKY